MADLGAIPLAISLLVWAARFCGRGQSPTAGSSPSDAPSILAPLEQVVSDGVLGNAAYTTLTATLRAIAQIRGPNALPNDSGLQRASCTALRQSILWILFDHHRRRTPEEVIADFKQYARAATDYEAFVLRALKRSPQRNWYRAFARVLASESFEDWHATLVMTEQDARRAFLPERCDLQEFLTRHVLAYARHEMRTWEEPADLAAMLESRRTEADTDGRDTSVTLAEAYGLFWRQQILAHPELLNAFLLEQLEPLQPALQALSAQVARCLDVGLTTHTQLLGALGDVGANVAEVKRVLKEHTGGASDATVCDVFRRYHSILSLLPQEGFRRVWFERQFDAWVSEVFTGRAPTYLVLEAGPFFGKSWIAASVLRHWKEAGRKVAFHAFRRNEGFVDEVDAFRALGRQLCELNGLPLARCETLLEFVGIIDSVTARQRLTGAPGTVVIIDGLDEAFGPSGRRPSDADDFLPELSHRTEPPGVAFLITLRPEFRVLWRDDPKRCRLVELPSPSELVEELARALVQLREHRLQRHAEVPPVELLPHFARAAEGQIGLACDIFLRAPPHVWERWERDPQSIPQGVAESLLGLWTYLSKLDQRRALDRRDLRWVCTLLAHARQPLTLEQLTLLDGVSLRHPLISKRPASLTRAGADAHLPGILEHCACLFAEPGNENPRRYFFRHSRFPELLRREGPVESPYLPSEQETQFVRALFAHVALGEWSQEESALRGYALRHGPWHLADAGRVKELVSLLCTDGFLKKLGRVDPDRPDLPSAALRLAVELLSRNGLPARCEVLFGLVGAYAAHRVYFRLETPLQALEDAGIGRAASVIAALRNVNFQFLQGLIVALRLEEQGRLHDAEVWWQQLQKLVPTFEPGFPDTKMGVALLARLAQSRPATCLHLATRVLPKNALSDWLDTCDEAVFSGLPPEPLRRLIAERGPDQPSLPLLLSLARVTHSDSDFQLARQLAESQSSGCTKTDMLLKIAGASNQDEDVARVEQAWRAYSGELRDRWRPDLRPKLMNVLARAGRLDQARALAAEEVGAHWQFCQWIEIARCTRSAEDRAVARKALSEVTDFLAQNWIRWANVTGERDDFVQAARLISKVSDPVDHEILIEELACALARHGFTAAACEISTKCGMEYNRFEALLGIAVADGSCVLYERACHVLAGEENKRRNGLEVYDPFIRLLVQLGHSSLASAVTDRVAQGLWKAELQALIGAACADPALVEIARSTVRAAGLEIEAPVAWIRIASATGHDTDWAQARQAVRAALPHPTLPKVLAEASRCDEDFDLVLEHARQRALAEHSSEPLLDAARCSGRLIDFQAVMAAAVADGNPVSRDVKLQAIIFVARKHGLIDVVRRCAAAVSEDFWLNAGVTRALCKTLSQSGQHHEAEKVAAKIDDTQMREETLLEIRLSALVDVSWLRERLNHFPTEPDARAQYCITLARSTGTEEDWARARGVARSIPIPELRAPALLEVARHTQRAADFEALWSASITIQNEGMVMTLLLQAAAAIRPCAECAERIEQWRQSVPRLLNCAMEHEEWLLATLPAVLTLFPQYATPVHDLVMRLVDAAIEADSRNHGSTSEQGFTERVVAN